MGTASTMRQITQASPHCGARLTAAFYVLTILLGGIVLFVHGRMALAIDLIATACYIALTALFYDLSIKAERRYDRSRGK